jgi:hypothetical protein
VYSFLAHFKLDSSKSIFLLSFLDVIWSCICSIQGFVLFSTVGIIAVFVILVLIGGGRVRHVPISFNEIIQTTVAFAILIGRRR